MAFRERSLKKSWATSRPRGRWRPCPTDRRRLRGRALRRGSGREADRGADVLAAQGASDVAALRQLEHLDREIVVAAEGDRRRVHDPDLLGQELVIGQARDHPRLGVLLGVPVVDPVDLGRLVEGIRTDLHRPQRGRRVGGEVGVARPGREDHDPPLLEVPDRPAPNVGLGHLGHLDGGLNAGRSPTLLERVLQGQRVHHGGQHTHVVGRGAVHPLRRPLEAAEDIPTTDDQGEPNAPIVMHLDQLIREQANRTRIEAEAPFLRAERLTRHLEQNALAAILALAREVFTSRFRTHRRHLTDLPLSGAII